MLRFFRNSRGSVNNRIVFIFMVLSSFAIIALAACFIYTLLADVFHTPEPEVTHVAETYLRALVTGGTSAAQVVSTGNAAQTDGKLEGQNQTARVTEISTSVQALGHGWARVEATVNLTLADGTANVRWYKLDVVKEASGWKVASFSEEEPDLSRRSLKWGGRAKDVEAAREVLHGYLEALAAGKRDEAANYLVGQARDSMKAGRDVLGKGKVIGKVDDLQAERVWVTSGLLQIEFSCNMDGKAVKLMTEFYHTPQGWLITAVR